MFEWMLEVVGSVGIKLFGVLKRPRRDFPGGPVAKTALPMQGTWVRSLVRELDPTCHN